MRRFVIIPARCESFLGSGSRSASPCCPESKGKQLGNFLNRIIRIFMVEFVFFCSIFFIDALSIHRDSICEKESYYFY